MSLAKSSIGFGCYRISSRSKDHADALIYALKNGCDLLDTSANYTNGESETLIGNVLKEYSDLRPVIMTKGGYIQGQNLDLISDLHSKGKAKEDLVNIHEELMHSIHPDFLDSQIEASLKRLQIEKIDYYLLHNPEYYFQDENSSQDGYYKRIEKAFAYLEEQVEKGRIGAYGISSNNLPYALDHEHVTDLDKVFQAARNVSKNHHFQCIQFPLNLLEIGGVENYSGTGNLIQKAKGLGLKTLINRPLNAFSNNSLLRLATYDEIYPPISMDQATSHYENCVKILKDKWDAQDSGEEIINIPLFKQIDEIWSNLPSPDAVDQVFFGNFFPFIARVWGGDLTAKESKPFYELYEIAENLSRQQMTLKANQFREQAVKLGLLPDSPDKNLSLLAVEFYLQQGVDHVLVGMRHRKYIDQFKELFK